MKKPLFLVLAAATALSLPACKPDTAKTATEASRHPASPAEVQAQFAILRDSTDIDWERMIASDDQKLADMHALLSDLRKQPTVKAAQLEPLRQATSRLKSLRYNRESMVSSALIDRYDAAQDSVLKVMVPLAAPDGNAPTAHIRDYVEHIQLADANVIAYRVHYDRAAKAYNDYLQVHRDEFAKMGGKFATFQPLPLFEAK